MKWILLLIMLVPMNSLAVDKKCMKRKDVKNLYGPQKVKLVSNYGHVLVLNESKYQSDKGYQIDVFALQKVPVKDKKTNKVTHYNKCLVQVKKKMMGTYIYGSFSRSSVKIRSGHKIELVSFRGP